MTKEYIEIENPRIRVVDDLKQRNAKNGKIIAQEYFGSKFTYEETFKMFDDYKKGFLSLDDRDAQTIILSAPSTVSSVNTFYGAIDANKIIAPLGPGFLTAFTEKYVKEMNSKTVLVFDGFLTEELISNLHKAGIKNVIVTSITDYMSPIVKFLGKQTGQIAKGDFLDNYVKSGKFLPHDMQFIRLKDFAKDSAKIKETINFPYEEDKIAAYFLTGATTSVVPKCVKVYGDGLTTMAKMYDKSWFTLTPGDRNTVFIPLFYATGLVHSVHAGFFCGSTNIYKPKYDRFAFAKDLVDSKANIAVVAPSHLAALETAKLKDGALSNLTYICIGGEAVAPAAMEKYRTTAKRLGIKYIVQGYGMTESNSMAALSDKYDKGGDVTVEPMPGTKFRIVNPETREELPINERGVVEYFSPAQSAGYTDKEKTKNLFTSDGWINTDDIGVKYADGSYRIFGRRTDYFKNRDKSYAMFDIEEEILKHPGVIEAEVIKFGEKNNEYPAIVLVVKDEYQNQKDLSSILKYIADLKLPGMEYLIGTRFISHFDTNPITAKRDYLSLQNYKEGYYKLFNEINIKQIDITDDNGFIIKETDSIKIFGKEKEMTLKRIK